MIEQYILDENGDPKRERDLFKWGEWFEHHDRHVLLDKLPDGVTVSTVFLGLDHNFGPSGPPVLWETMIFGGPHHHYQKRYSQKSEAIEGHIHALQLALSKQAVP